MKKLCAFMCVMVFLLALPLAAGALTLTLEYDIEFSGATPPAGESPWLEARFDDGGTPGSVELKLEAGGLTADEFVSNWYFNLDPALNPLSLGPFTQVGDLSEDPQWTVQGFGVDAFKADGDGLYDILIGFGNNSFGAGDEAMFLITGIPTLTANDFNFFSTPDGGAGTFLSAAHVQGIGPDGEYSGWAAPSQPTPNLPPLCCWALAYWVSEDTAIGKKELRKSRTYKPYISNVSAHSELRPLTIYFSKNTAEHRLRFFNAPFRIWKCALHTLI